MAVPSARGVPPRHQALAIAKRNCEGRTPEQPLFAIVDARKTLAWVNRQAGTTVQGHDLCATFASIAEELVSGAMLKHMLNHSAGDDVTLGHYIGKSEAQRRADWQTVADFIDAAAERFVQKKSARPTRQPVPGQKRCVPRSPRVSTPPRAK